MIVRTPGRLRPERSSLEVRSRHAPIAEAIGPATPRSVSRAVGMEKIAAHEIGLTARAIELLTDRTETTWQIFGPTDT